MEERLSEPLPLLSLDNDWTSLQSVASTTGPFTTPSTPRDTQEVIHWQAAGLLSRLDTDVLVDFVPKLAGAFCEIDKVPIITSYMNMLLLLHEKDNNMQWITRIPYQQEDPEFLPEQVEPVVRARKKFSFKVPYLYHYGLAKDPGNPLGMNFMLLEFIDGRMMTMWTETFPSWDQKKQVLAQIVGIYIEMLSKTVTYEDRLVLDNANGDPAGIQEDFDTFDLPPNNSTRAYFHRLVDDAIRGKIERLTADDAQEQAELIRTTMDGRYTDLLTLLMMRALIPTQVIGVHNNSPFYIAHPDLHNRNIIIEGKPLQEPPAIPTRKRSFTPPGGAISLQGQPQRPRAASIVGPNSSKPDKLKVVGIIDWDKAQPVPLQCAAIYPKFLETLPGAEFPDLPDDYKPPNLDPEKETYIEIFSKKELQHTGKTIVTDLIRNGSWERDFFHVALGRGDVRLKWLQWWKKEQVEQGLKPTWLWDDFVQKDIDNIRAGLQWFLGVQKNKDTVSASYGWGLISRIVVDLERFQTAAAESSWIRSSRKKWAPVKPVRLQGCALKAGAPTRVTSQIRDIEGKSSSSHQGGLPEPAVPKVPLVVDNYLKFTLGDEPGRIIKVEGGKRRVMNP